MSGDRMLTQEQANIPADISSVVDGIPVISTWELQQHSNGSDIPEGCLVVEKSSLGFIPWDNPDNLISQETEQAVDTAVGAICLPLLFLLSLPANLLNMLVFSKHGLSERINLCLFYLSLVDLLHMLNMFLANVDKILAPLLLSQPDAGVGPVLEFLMNHRLVGLQGFLWLSGCVSMLIACERCLCVVSPLRSHTILETRTTAVLLVGATLVILTGSMMIGLRWGLACMYNPATNTTSKIIYTSTFYAQNKAHLDVLTLFVGTVQPSICLIVVFATTIVTSVKLKRMIVWRQQTSSCALTSGEVALTRMLIVVSVLYLLCSAPTMIAGLAVVFVPGFSLSGKYYNFSKALVSLAKLASYINATFNFCVYCSVGSRFRDTLCQLFPCTAVMPVSANK